MEELLVCVIHSVIHVAECHVDIEGDYMALYDESTGVALPHAAERSSHHLRSFYERFQFLSRIHHVTTKKQSDQPPADINPFIPP